MADLFIGGTSGAAADVTSYNNNWLLLESTFSDFGNYVISGLAISAGAGLQVAVATGTAVIGGHVAVSVGFNIGGLAPSTVNHIYLLRNGTGTSNTTGTAPSNSTKLGTATTDGSGVTSVAQTHASGRQLLVRHENLVHGSGPGHPRAVNLASHHASNQEGNETYGVLPEAAFGGAAYVVLAPATTARNTVQSTANGANTLTLKQKSGQTAALLQIQDSAAATMLQVDANGRDITLDATTGSKFGTAASQRLAFFGATPIVQPVTNSDIRTALVNLGLLAGGANPLNTNGGAIVVGAASFSGDISGSGATAFSVKRYSRTFTSDADYTLLTGEADAVVIDVQQEGGPILTTTRNIIVPGTGSAVYRVVNRNAQSIGLKTSGGTAILVPPGHSRDIYFPTGVNAFAAGHAVDYTGAPTAYTFTNGTIDRTVDCNATTLDEVIDVVFTLWTDLKNKGIVG
jgi:hypothetical protein